MVYSATKAASGDDQPTKYYYPMNIVIHSLNKQAGRWDYINISILPRQAKMKRISISELARQLFSPVILRRSSVQIRFFFFLLHDRKQLLLSQGISQDARKCFTSDYVSGLYRVISRLASLLCRLSIGLSLNNSQRRLCDQS